MPLTSSPPDTSDQKFVDDVIERIEQHRFPYGRHALPLTDARLNALLSTSAQPDRWSRIVESRTGISTLEIALLADALSVHAHWLITGEPDPFEVTVISRGCHYPFDD